MRLLPSGQWCVELLVGLSAFEAGVISSSLDWDPWQSGVLKFLLLVVFWGCLDAFARVKRGS